MSIAKNTKEVYLEEIIDNLNGNTRALPIDCKPRTREEVLLAAIEMNTRNRTGGGDTGGGTGGGPSNPSDYLHKVNDKALLSDLSGGKIDDKYITPAKLVEYLSSLIINEGINVFSINGRSGAVTLSRNDVELENVDNIKQAPDEEYRIHIADYDNAHITAVEKRNIYNKISEMTSHRTDVLLRTDKCGLEDVINGTDDSTYVTPKALAELLKNEIGEVGALQEVSVTTINGKHGNIVLSREDLDLDNLINERQATKVEFDAHLDEMENYHVSASWRNSIISRIEALEKMVNTMLPANMKATTDLAIEGTDDSTYITPLGIKAIVDSIMTQTIKEEN